MDTQKVNSWAEDKLIGIKSMAVISLVKMGYSQLDAEEAVDIFMYFDIGLLWRRFKERRLGRGK